MTDLQGALDKGNQFAKDNLIQLAKELRDWQDTGLLVDGKLRQLGEICKPVNGLAHLRLAQDMVSRAALDHVYAPHSKPTVYGSDCPVGKVQVAFVGCAPSEKQGEYGWRPVDSAMLDIYVDGRRFYLQVGDFHDGVAERRGLHIVTSSGLRVELTSINAASLRYEKDTP